ncbi:hypothetical protein ACLB2K_071684 [Fragaria x ananassa]
MWWDTVPMHIPETIGGLLHFSGLKKGDVGRLMNLRHLYVKNCNALLEGIDKLTDLQTLDQFYVRAEGNKLEHLENLNQLQGSLTILTWGDPKMAEKANMANKAHLLHLRLYVDSGKLPSLESLDIKRFDRVEKVGVEFLGIKTRSSTTSSSFPKLKQLTMRMMGSWKEWGGVPEEVYENITIMPCLSELTIEYCEKLRELPDFLWQTPLQNLKVEGSQFLEHLNANWPTFLKSKHS